MRKHTIALLLCALMFVTFTGCSKDKSENVAPAIKADTTTAPVATATASSLPALTKDTIKVGFIYGSSIGNEGYTYTHNLGRLALEKEGIKTMYLENVPETADCEKAARDLIEQGCNVIYAISFGYMQYIANVADEYPNVYFNHATGYITKPNMSTYMGRMYEAQYLTGIAVGLKTKTGKIGFVTTFPIPECVRQVNAFTLGVRSVNPTAVVEVKWTSSWYDPATEKSAATELINKGCDVISAYCDTMNPQMAAAEKGLWATGCSSPGGSIIPDAYLTAPIFHYDVFYSKDVQRILDGTWKSGSSWLGLADGVVGLDELTKNCASGTSEKIEPVKQSLINGSFDMWTGEIKDNQGNVRVKAGETMDDSQLLALDWFVEGVIGSVK
ncbi:BMP family ABC transporter substrate-binding protein [uncultured Sphaerochaeta sp.]|uniref:BMP family ABC transporter substrate-binding protein n=1 Tax=uncultured Sphaerochaeta sp. TaxID=886478 RepID=UPI002A0A37CA|nr:BMP family ABC transporter substrate-binding protein [uncultured Sphaerochaeta sp.]